jgi:hypothetical protein
MSATDFNDGIFDPHEFFNEFEKTVLGKLPLNARRVAQDRLDNPGRDDSTLLIVIALAGKAHRAMLKAEHGPNQIACFDQATSVGAKAILRSLRRPSQIAGALSAIRYRLRQLRRRGRAFG